MTQSVERLATSWTVRGSNPVEATFYVPVPTPSTEVKERLELCLYFPSGPPWPVLGRISLYVFLQW
jgi:hypothetical protein